MQRPRQCRYKTVRVEGGNDPTICDLHTHVHTQMHTHTQTRTHTLRGSGGREPDSERSCLEEGGGGGGEGDEGLLYVSACTVCIRIGMDGWMDE